MIQEQNKMRYGGEGSMSVNTTFLVILILVVFEH